MNCVRSSGFSPLLVIAALLLLALTGCSNTVLTETQEGIDASGKRGLPNVFQDGSLGENTAFELIKLETVNGTKLTKLKVAKDQTSALKTWALIKGWFGLAGEAVNEAAHLVEDALE